MAHEIIEYESFNDRSGTEVEVYSTTRKGRKHYHWRIYRSGLVIASSLTKHRFKQLARLEAMAADIQDRSTWKAS